MINIKEIGEFLNLINQLKYWVCRKCNQEGPVFIDSGLCQKCKMSEK